MNATNKRICISLLFLTTSVACFAAETDYGAELDVLPYLTGGYYISAWGAQQNYRLRLVQADINVPSFATKKNFKDHKLQASALIVDYFFQRERTGWWLGGGYEYWRNSIRNKSDDSKADFDQHVATVGGGYVLPMTAHFYVNSWGALHVPFAGDSRVQVGSRTYRPQAISGEVSLKFGYVF